MHFSPQSVYGSNAKLISITNTELRNILMVGVQSNNTELRLRGLRITGTGEAGVTIFGSKKPKLDMIDCGMLLFFFLFSCIFPLKLNHGVDLLCICVSFFSCSFVN